MLKSVNINYLDANFDLSFKTIETTKVHRDDLVFACKQPFNEKLFESIERTGMRLPLIVIDNTKTNHDEAIIDVPNSLPWVEGVPYLVVYGNQRLRCLDDLGKEHDIPVMIAKDHWEAILIHQTLNNIEDR